MSIQTFIVALAIVFNFIPNNISSIKVEVNGIKSLKGDVIISLYNRSDHFPKGGDKYIYKKVKLKVVNNKVSYSFTGLPQGEYAVAIHHDENANGEFDFNFVGYPLEGYGFSRNFKPKFSAPVFKDVSFNLDEDKMIQIEMIN